MPPPPTMPITDADRMSDSKRSRMYDRMFGEVAGPQHTQRDRDRDGEHGPPQRDAHGDDALPRVLADVGEGRLQVALQEHADVTDVARQLERSKLDDPGGHGQRDGEPEDRGQVAADRGVQRWSRWRRLGPQSGQRAAEQAHTPAPASAVSSRAPNGAGYSPKISTSIASVSSAGGPLKTRRPSRRPRTRSA